MKKNIVRDVIVHVSEKCDRAVLAESINEFHAGIIERRLDRADMTAEEKAEVIDKIAELLRSEKP